MRKLVTFIAVALAALSLTAAASATVFPTDQQLKFEGYGVHYWNMRGGDSPHDRNAWALKIRVGDPSAGEYVAAYSRRSLNIAKDVDAVTNLSFEYRTDKHVGAGAPRITVEFQNGDIGYLSALYCNHPMAVTGGVWGRADFTRYQNNCSFFVTGETGGQYAADGTRSAMAVYAAAHPDQVVQRTYFVADESGNYRIDRLSLGAGVMYQNGNLHGRICTTEASC